MLFGVQTRLFKLVSCKPEDSDFLHDETRSWCIHEKKKKDEADVFCVKRKQAQLQASECTRKLMQELMITSQYKRMPQQKRTWQVLPIFSAYCYIQLHRTVMTLLIFWAWSSYGILNT
jgi:hypothetical protein